MLPQRSERYLAFIRSCECAVCGRAGEPHHAKKNWHPVSTGGAGIKGSDFCTIPLCRSCHQELHQRGQHDFEALHAILIDRLIPFYLVRFIEALPDAKAKP